MAIAGTPSVQGFEWSPTPGLVPAVPGENGWCMRDAVCQLFGWRPGSEEWLRFIEAPTGRDLIRLAMHLGLTVFEVGAPGSWDELSHRAAHPGVAMFFFPGTWRAHTAYVPDAQWLLRYWPAPDGRPNRQPPRDTGWPLDKRYMDRSPVLFAVFIDERRPPRSEAPRGRRGP